MMLKGIKKDSTYLKHYVSFAILLYVVVAIGYMVLGGYKEDIPSYMETDRLLVVGYYMLMLGLAFTRNNIKTIAFVNSVLFLIVVVTIKMTYAESGLDIFGNAHDSYGYLNAVMKYGDLSYSDYWEHVLRARRLSTADLGYFTIVYLCYHIYPDFNAVVLLLLIINVICIYISTIYMYKIQQLFDCYQPFSKFTALLYASSPFVVMTAVSGLKEIVFVTIIILAVYYITISYFHRTITNIAIAFIFSFLCIYFRTAVAFMLFISLIVSITITEYNKKVYLSVIVFSLFFTGFLLPLILEQFMQVSLDDIMDVAERRYDAANSGVNTSIVSTMSGLLGPFPNFDRQGSYAFIHSMALFMKNAFNIFFFFGIYHIVKSQEIKFYPVLIFVSLSIMMVIIAGVSLDMRFHITYLPFFYIIAINAFKKHIAIDFSFLLLMLAIIYIYSTRAVSTY